MTTEQEKQELIEILKFTPRTYTVHLWGYGGEWTMGTVSREIYDYFKRHRLDLNEYAWDSDYAEAHDIPEDMQPFPSGSWYDCDDICHESGVDRSAGTLQIIDENGETVYQRSMDDINGCEAGDPEFEGDGEYSIDEQDAGTVVFIGTSSEKGTFFEGALDLTAPFDITKLKLSYNEIDGNEIIAGVVYDGEDIEGHDGYSTTGKSSDFGFYIAGSQKNGKWERYKDKDDIEYTLTEWFPSTVDPVREGMYNVETVEERKYQAMWNGQFWHNDWNDEKLEIKQWQGIDHDPDADLDNVDTTAGSWPF
jgi:hypothetical protein